jgi:integrase
MFNDAVKWDFMDINPMRSVSMLHEEEVSFHFWSEDEAKSFLSYCNNEVYPIFCCALNTGMRIGEILGLKWISVNIKHRIITVERSRLGSTKNKRVRYIFINDVLYDALRKLRTHKTQEYVFPGKNGDIRKDLRGSFNNAIQRAGIERIRIHDLRQYAENRIMPSRVTHFAQMSHRIIYPGLSGLGIIRGY